MLGVWPVFMQKEKPRQKLPANAKKLHYSTVLVTKIRTLSIENLLLNPYSSNKKDNYIFFDTPLDFSIFTACSNQKKSSSTPTKKLII